MQVHVAQRPGAQSAGQILILAGSRAGVAATSFHQRDIHQP